MKRKVIQLFTFGYWGWGNHTKELVQLIDRTERLAGYVPPMFVDIRMNRSVRAKGFHGDNFKELVGAQRYEHMKSLGNARIVSGRGGIEIANPAAAADLLDMAVECARENRRLIYFCACVVPASCHRRTVAELVEKEGRKRQLIVTNSEWPGGEPEYRELTISPELYKEAARVQLTVPLPGTAADLRSLPWYSVVKYQARASGRDKSFVMYTGPARFKKGGWRLPVFKDLYDPDKRRLLSEAKKWRKKEGYEAP